MFTLQHNCGIFFPGGDTVTEKEFYKYSELTVGERIKLIREAFDLSQADFGERISLDRSTVSLLESGKRKLTERSAKDICRSFNVSHMFLTEGYGEIFTKPDIGVVVKIDYIFDGNNEDHKNLIRIIADMQDKDKIRTLCQIAEIIAEKKTD